MRKSKNFGIIPLKHPCLKLIGSLHRKVIKTIASLGAAALLSSWVREVEKTAEETNWLKILPGKDEEYKNTFKGDALELLGEYELKLCPSHNKHGLSNYTVVPLQEDYGVDATGLNVQNEIVVVQYKFRTNPLDVIHYSDLARTFASGITQFNLNSQAKKNLWLVTTGQDANSNAHKIFGSRLHVLGYNHLRKQVDGNTIFWANFLASIEKVLKPLSGVVKA
jgi:hypothetical protein